MIMNKLYETENYILYFDYEIPILHDKRNDSDLKLKDHYGDPSCGLIDFNENWCAVGGEGVSIFLIHQKKEIRVLEKYFIHSVKQLDENNLRILIDPWSENPGVWELNIKSFKISKISDNPDLKNKPYHDLFSF